MSKNYQNIHNLKVSTELLSFINNELLKDLDISTEVFWLGFDKIVHEIAPLNKELLKTCLLYTSPSPRDPWKSRMPSSA